MRLDANRNNAFDNYQKILNHQRIQTGVTIAQAALTSHMAGTLHQLQGEMGALHEMNLQGLAIQQEMLKREQFQSQVEEFIYNIQKMVAEFSDEKCKESSVAKYFNLKGILDTVEELGIGTPLIKGRGNKAAFESAFIAVNRLVDALASVPEVEKAVEEFENEQRHLAIRQQREIEQRETLLRKINGLRATRKKAPLEERVKCGFDLFINNKPPFNGDFYERWFGKEVAKWVNIFACCIMPVPGMGWILAWILVPDILKAGAVAAESNLNSAVDAEIMTLERQLAAI